MEDQGYVLGGETLNISVLKVDKLVNSGISLRFKEVNVNLGLPASQHPAWHIPPCTLPSWPLFSANTDTAQSFYWSVVSLLSVNFIDTGEIFTAFQKFQAI